MGRGTKRKTVKIAVCNFQGRVCPRFDLTPEILVFDISHLQEEPTEKIDVYKVPPEEITSMLAERKVCAVIAGGIQERFQRMFLNNKIDLIWGVTGEVHEVLQAYREGTLHSGIGTVPEVKKKVASTPFNRQNESQGRRRGR